MDNTHSVAADQSDEPVHSESHVGPKLAIDVADSFNYAAWQSAVPLLRSVVIDNTNGPELSALTVEMTASFGFARPKRWLVDRVNAGTTLKLQDVDVDIDPTYLDGLDEAERGILTFRLLLRDTAIHESKREVRVLARDEWGGMSSMGELLPAYVTPNDPALAPLLKSAAGVLGESSHSTALDGYQTNDPSRAYLLAAALWSAIAGKSLTYANPPGSFEQVGQKTRRVATVLTDGLATCLDTSLLFASGLEAMGLNPVLVMTKGHCFVGVWLVGKTFKRLVEQDCSEVRKAIGARELILFETTLVTHQPPARFPDAVAVATGAVAVEKEHDFVAVIDVARARMSQILPLASHTVRKETPSQDQPGGPLPLPAAPCFESLPALEVEERPITPTGRIERWQRKLLDLSLRNRLLNFRPTKQTVPVLCPDVSRLEDRLADGKRLRLVSLADGNPLAQRDAQLHQRRTQKDLDWEFAKQALERDEIACPVDLRELDVRLTALFRKVRNDLAEGGSNTLYLAVGFLRWKQTPTDEKSYRAPLLLIPVKLMRRSASSPFYLANHEDEVRFNATLLQMLKKDFGCNLTHFEDNLPTDDSGVDVGKVLDRMRQAVRDIPGFEVMEEAAIASFSFAKYLMWKDLVDRVGELEHNRVVRHLIHDPDQAFSTDGISPMPRPHEIDTRYRPEQIVHPLPADSSQLAAVMSASEGHDMVIVGPPGTGKSQTIANLIAQCLSVGKTVLFVAEKTAALDVVYRRLREHGLGDCCIELHSNKAERRRFLDQLEASWKHRGNGDDSNWGSITGQLRIRRDQLNAYAAAVHTPEANGWTAYRAMGECVRGRDVDAPRLDWPASVHHDRQAYAELQIAISELATACNSVPAKAAIGRVLTTEWSMAWETRLLKTCEELASASEAMAAVLASLSQLLAAPQLSDISATQLPELYRLATELARPTLPTEEILSHARLDDLKAGLDARAGLLERAQRTAGTLEAALVELCRVLDVANSGPVPAEKKRQLYRLANELVQPDLPPAELVFHQQFSAIATLLADREALLNVRAQSVEALKARLFNEALIDRIDVEAVEHQWAKALKSIWPLSAWRRSATKKVLKTYMATNGTAEPNVDLPLLRDYKNVCVRLAENLASLGLPVPLQAAVENNARGLVAQLSVAARLRDAMNSAGFTPDAVGTAAHGTLKPLAESASHLFPPGRELEILRGQLKENLTTIELSPELKKTVERDARALDAQVQAAKIIRKAVGALGILNEDTQILKSILAAPEQIRRDTASACCQRAKAFQNTWGTYTECAGAMPVAQESTSVITDAATQARTVLSRRRNLKLWTAWMAARSRAEQFGLTSFVEALISGGLKPADAADRFRLAYARWWLPAIVDRREPLRAFQRFLHENAIDDFCRLDDLARQAAAPRARHAVLHNLPPSDQAPRKSELGLLRHQMSLKRPSKSIREVIGGMPEVFAQLAPCLLMSPLSIAQYLPTSQAPFDVVVFDEASQIPTWDAIGAIARGKQTIIVGDPKQLPPTNFFGRAESDEDNSELEDYEKDLESILDEATASGLPTLQLNWHYRSKHESLIAFSNWNYYGNRLVTFPAAESADRGVSLKYIEGAIYDRGKSRTNRLEAEAIVADAVARMKRCLRKPEDKRLTYGVVTFNSQQQELIQDLFDLALRQDPELEWFFADERIEPTAVKNLENVQGDERDVMMFSITFGFDAAGKFPVDFGAINRDGGERRLNVAVTRARQELVVYASFLPEQFRAEKSGARGIHDLKAFLEYAEKGPNAIIARTEGSLGSYESPLEEAVAAALEERGWHVDPQVGVSGFRIDIGIVHPNKPGAYLAGVECDGATYHRSSVARDRDKIRQQVLENLGWSIVRVWSTDWWYAPEAAIEQLDGALRKLLQSGREGDANEEALAPGEPHDGILPAVDGIPDSPTISESAYDPRSRVIEGLESAEATSRPQLFARQSPADMRRLYTRSDLGDAVENQIRFFDDDYSEVLRSMALSVLDAQGPIRDDALARELARAHGFARTGNRIKERVMQLLPNVVATEESVGRFLWPGPEAENSIPFRYSADDKDRRSLEEVPLAELIGLVRQHPILATSDDPAIALAREIGLTRLARGARARLEEAAAACEERP
jgi:very-short-patch-repair endonuclease